MEINRSTQIFSIFKNNLKGPIPHEALPILVDWGLIPKEGDYLCNNGHPLKLVPSNDIDGWTWRCWHNLREKKLKGHRCNAHVSLRKNTFFSKSHLNICQILIFAYLWTENVSLDFITRETDIESRSTAVDWNNFCREVVLFGSFQTNLKIGGPDIIVEIDESKIGKRKYHRGHHVEGQWVFGGVERISGKCFIVPVEDRSRETLIPLIQQYISPGSIIVSDFWKSYDALTNIGYKHLKVNHSVSFVDAETGQHTNTIEGLWRHLKQSVPEYNRRKHFFNGYVQKFIFLRWCKSQNKNKYVEFLKLAGKMYNPLQPNNNIENVTLMAAESSLDEESESE